MSDNKTVMAEHLIGQYQARVAADDTPSKPEGWTWGFSELVGKAIHAARPHRTTPAERWVAVRDSFQVGSTTAKTLCLHFGFDPYEEVPGVKCGACAEEDVE